MTSNSLCLACDKLNLRPLFRTEYSEYKPQLSNDINELSTKHEVHLVDFSFHEAILNFNCRLCALIVKCGTLAGLAVRGVNHDGRDALNNTVKLRCCLRPKLAWTNIRFRGEDTGQPRVRHTGHIVVDFHYRMVDRKEADDAMRRVGRPGVNAGPDEKPTNRRKWFFARHKDKNVNSLSDPAAPTSSTSAVRTAFSDIRLEPKVKQSVASWQVDILGFNIHELSQSRRPINSEADLSLLASWLRECTTQHRHASQLSGALAPLDRPSIGHHMKAIDTATGEVTHITLDETFVALSYVWGSASSSRRETQPAGHASGLMSYPARIRDAAKLSRLLGFRWLWVDQICIDQSDEREKAILIPYMKDIFAAAELTIVAADGRDVSIGLSGVSDGLRSREELFQIPNDGANFDLVPAPRSFNVVLECSTWRTRGWTFQEATFARRLLYIYKSEIFFSCARGTGRESAGPALSDIVVGSTWADDGRTPPTIVGQLHAKIHSNDPLSFESKITCRDLVRAIEEYSGRDLKFEADRIEAFAGIIFAASSTTAGSAIDHSLLRHGNPLQYFETLLTWYCEPPFPKGKPESGFVVAPTWSWATAGARVRFFDNGEEHKRNNWFKYVRVGKLDILGVAMDRSIPYVSELSLPFTDPAATLREWTERLDQPSQGSPTTALPMLHLVTITFGARLLDLHGAQPSPLYRHRQGNHGLINPDTRLPFALAGGQSHMYLLVLWPAGEPNTFIRLGILRLSLYQSSITSVMRQGGAQWRHIRIT